MGKDAENMAPRRSTEVKKSVGPNTPRGPSVANAESPRDEHQNEPGKYIVACLVLPRSPPDEKLVKDRQGGFPRQRIKEEHAGWGKEMQEELLSGFSIWPKDQRDVKDIVKVNGLRHQDWEKLENALDEEGMIKPVPGSDA